MTVHWPGRKTTHVDTNTPAGVAAAILLWLVAATAWIVVGMAYVSFYMLWLPIKVLVMMCLVAMPGLRALRW